ncbi:MAG: hypothetical protein JXB29_06895 [Sedimentisphaerales bacterium]|nr:hypothetical protein [Sedimentisphaerales bacterium]
MPTQKYVVIIFQAGKNSYIDPNTFYKLQLQLDKVITTKKNNTEIDVWLDSPGGDAHTAYKLWLELRTRANKLRAWVPDFAKSAATLFVLGMDEIYMAPSAELGPLDVQIEHPDRENITVSALDVSNALDYLSNFAVQLAILGGAELVKYTHLSRSEVLKEVLPFTAKLIKPCIDKIDPTLTRRAVVQLQVAEHYAQKMLAERNVTEQQRLSAEDTKTLITKLVGDYPVHQCVIGREEAKTLKLPVYNAEDKPQWTKLKKVYEQFMKSRTPLLTVLLDSKQAIQVKGKNDKKKKKANNKQKGAASED